jgi:aminoglycoside 3-N-acetyltransferase
MAVSIRILKQILPQSLQARLRSGWETVSFYFEQLHSVDKEVLRRTLRELGLRPGEVVFVHAAYGQMRTIRATPLEIIEILCKVVGDAGTVVMPTFPMRGSSQAYLDRHPVFDWRRTPSMSGLLTEVFRRTAGIERSLHPTHPVAARGAAAAWLTSGHEHSRTPFDEHSPFHKLFLRDALILSLGRFDAMTFRHLADHLIQDRISYPIYCDRLTSARAIDKDGREHSIVTRGHNPNLHCNHQAVLDRMAREGLRRTAKVGRVPLSLVRARDYIETYHRCQREGLICYSLGTDHAAGRLVDGPRLPPKRKVAGPR